MTVINANLTNTLRHCHRQFPTRGFISKEYIAECRTSFTATKPHIKNCRNVFTFPSQDCGSAREIQQDNRLTRLFESYQKVALSIGHLQVTATAALTTHFRRLPYC